jgi:Fe-S-cluster-containing hydrogenase component 2
MSFNHIDNKVIKCDLCEGDPQCVRFCEVHAVEFVESADVSISKKRVAAERLYTADKKANALEAKAA